MEQVFRECVREARDRGQTVLLSSHILSEVEAVCDRVAMLRAGRIIETGRLDVLRGLAALHVHAVVDGAVPDLSGLDGVSNVVVDGQHGRVRRRRLDGAAAVGAGRRRRRAHDDAASRRSRSCSCRTTATAVPRTVGGDECHRRRGAAAAGAGRAGHDGGRRGGRTAGVPAGVDRRAPCAQSCSEATAASSALSYVAVVPDGARAASSSPRRPAATPGSRCCSARSSAIDTVGGYTVYKGFVFLTTIGAIWAVLAATRLLRGEEDAGRWQLVLAGSTRGVAAPRPRRSRALGGRGRRDLRRHDRSSRWLAGRNPDVGFGVGDTRASTA